MKLSNKQADALKAWVNGAVILYATEKTRSQVGPAMTVNALCKRGLICKVEDGYQLTALGVAVLRRRGFFTRPLGANVE